MSVLASDRISEQMKRRLVRRTREARDSFDTKSEFPAIAPPPMKPNSILRWLLLPPLSVSTALVVITEHEVDIISRKGKARKGREKGKGATYRVSMGTLRGILTPSNNAYIFSTMT